MPKIFRYGLQLINYTLFMAMVWYFSINPPYRQLEEGQAVLTLAFAHAAKLREPCRRLTQEELAQLAPNMRLPLDCPRERSPVTIELYLDNKLVVKNMIEPPGWHKDQGVDFFHRMKLAVGKHQLLVRMNDDVNIAGPTYEYEKAVILVPEQQLLVDFDAASGGFFIN